MDKHIGAQYYTLRDYIKTTEDFDETCRKVAEMGYSIIQISASPLPAKDMREAADRHGLKTVVTHRNYKDFQTNLDEIIDYNKTLGCKICGIGMMPIEYSESAAKLSEFIDEAGRIAERLRKEDLYFGYHNHAFEFIKVDGERIMDRLISETDPDTFRFIVDTYWVQVGGCNPADFIKNLGKRAMAVHFKDFCVEKEDWRIPHMCEVGEGNLDWDSIIRACEAAGTEWSLVEQDICKRDPFESLKMSYDFLKTKGFC